MFGCLFFKINYLFPFRAPASPDLTRTWDIVQEAMKVPKKYGRAQAFREKLNVFSYLFKTFSIFLNV